MKLSLSQWFLVSSRTCRPAIHWESFKVYTPARKDYIHKFMFSEWISEKLHFSSSGPQKGPAERGHVKKRQKSSKSVKNIFGTFRQFSRRAKNVKNRQRMSKLFSTIFARHQFSGPFWGLWQVHYAAPIGAFFCPEIRAFTGFGGEISSTVSKVLSDRKVLFKHKNGR